MLNSYYFESVIDKLSLAEIEVLNTMTKQSAINKFSALKKKELFEEVELTETSFRKSLLILEAINFIEVSAGSRNHLLYVTEFGQQAIQNISERGNV